MRPGLQFALPEPIARYPYIDQIQFWLIDPLDQHTLHLIKTQCGKGGLHVSNKRAKFNRRFRQRVQLRQPTENAFRLLAQRNGILINGVEITLDLIFRNRAAKEAAADCLHQHLIRRWHGSRQEIRVRSDANGVIQFRYDARRSAPNKIALYPEDFTRVTGELYCLHLEWRAKGVKALRAGGIKSPTDLLAFDHRAFWQKRLCLYDVDRRKLGLMIGNRSTGRRHRTPKAIQRGKFRYPIDAATGEHYARKHETVQELIHHMKSFCRIHRALIPISNEMLLPPQPTFLLSIETNRQLDRSNPVLEDPTRSKSCHYRHGGPANLHLQLHEQSSLAQFDHYRKRVTT
jgi:hypothetical protein